MLICPVAQRDAKTNAFTKFMHCEGHCTLKQCAARPAGFPCKLCHTVPSVLNAAPSASTGTCSCQLATTITSGHVAFHAYVSCIQDRRALWTVSQLLHVSVCGRVACRVRTRVCVCMHACACVRTCMCVMLRLAAGLKLGGCKLCVNVYVRACV